MRGTSTSLPGRKSVKKMTGEVLVLNANYEPLNVCNMRRAVCLLYLGKAEVVHENGRLLRSFTMEIQSPSVVKLRYYVRRPLPQLRMSRRSIFARDAHRCQYCRLTSRDLTLDHVKPRRWGGRHTWDNVVACCRRCNAKKGDRPPSEVGMKLLRRPRRPPFIPYISLAKYLAGRKNELWRQYLPAIRGLAD